MKYWPYSPRRTTSPCSLFISHVVVCASYALLPSLPSPHWCVQAALFPFLSSARLMSPENTLLQPREEEGVKYERTFMASEFLDWLVQEGEATAREEAEQLCQRLLEHGIIQHGEPALPEP